MFPTTCIYHIIHLFTHFNDMYIQYMHRDDIILFDIYNLFTNEIIFDRFNILDSIQIQSSSFSSSKNNNE